MAVGATKLKILSYAIAGTTMGLLVALLLYYITKVHF